MSLNAEEISEDDSWDELDDDQKEELDHDRFVEELSEDFNNDPLEALERAEDVGLDIDDLEI